MWLEIAGPANRAVPGERDYTEKSQPGFFRHGNAGISSNRAEIFACNRKFDF